MKDYTLKDIPQDIHTLWKTVATLTGLSMRDYFFKILKQEAPKDLQKIKSNFGSGKEDQDV
jgi:hypothetical protein